MSQLNLHTTNISAKTVLGKSKQPVWPTVSIVFLIVIAIALPPALITGMNGYLLLLAFFSWIFSKEKFDSNLFKITMPFIVIIVIGIVGGAYNERYLYFKDAWYLLNPILIIGVGYVFYRNKPNVASGLRAFVVAGTVIGAIYLINLMAHPGLILEPSTVIRSTIGTGYYAPALSFTILCANIGRWDEKIGFPRKFSWLCFLICIFSMVLCFSRTMAMVALIGVVAAYGGFSRKKMQIMVVISILAALLIGALPYFVNVESREVQHTFVGKLARSFDEISVQEYTDFKSINENWRGYETAMALKMYKAGSPMQWFFGYGFGAQVDLGFEMRFGTSFGDGGNLKRYIPILHNGYAYLLIKGGLLAVFCFLGSLLFMYSIGHRYVRLGAGRIETANARVLQAIAVTLGVTTWFVSGVFNKLDMFPYILAAGYFVAAVTLNKVDENE